MGDRGHLFVIDGDLTKVACDAWLLPTDGDFDITDTWVGIFPPEQIETVIHEDWRIQRLTGVSWNGGGLGTVIKYGEISGVPVYLANIGHLGAHHSVYTGAVLEFIRLACEAHRPGQERPRLAINQVGSGHGGGRHVRGGILEKLIERLESAMSSGEVEADVIIASWGEKAEAAAQYLRLAGNEDSYLTSPLWHFSNDNLDLHSKARSLAAHFRARNACIFMGAGASGGAKIPTWSELLEQLASRAFPARPADFDSLDHLEKASRLKAKMGPDAFADEIKRALESKKYSLLHGLLSSLPCDEFITTNVEQLFEEAANSKQRGITILPSLREHHLIDRWLLKIHGCVSDPSSLVFTREDYNTSVTSRRALFGVLQAMLLTRHMLFVGYSLSDPDFREIVQEVRDALPPHDASDPAPRRKLGTILTLFTDNEKISEFEDLFDIVPISSVRAGHATAVEAADAIRDLERFIDLIGMLASDRSAFLLDSRYRGLLTPTEQNLATLLGNIAAAAPEFASANGWTEVWATLRSLGAHPGTIGDQPRPGIK